MAAKNSVKQYLKDGFYHIYNRGVEKRDIFLDEQDYNVFVSYLKTYIQPKDLIRLNSIVLAKSSSPIQKDKAQKLIKMKNFNGVIDLICYAIMPNHFHLLIKQSEENGINHFLNAIGTRYAGYFNRKYKRVGPLFQGVYKAVPINSDEQLLHVSRYIHLNPLKINKPNLPSSLPEFLGRDKSDWINSEIILGYFSAINSMNNYQSFMEDQINGELLYPLALDSDEE